MSDAFCHSPILLFTLSTILVFPSEDPYEEGPAQQVLDAGTTVLQSEGTYTSTTSILLSPRIRPFSPRGTRVEMRRMLASALYLSLTPIRNPPLVTLPLPTPSTSRRADIPEADTPPRKRLLLTTPRPGCEIGESSAAAVRTTP
ncbi:hypothetical protein Tco_0551404 [Tanacetum coccineum]